METQEGSREQYADWKAPEGVEGQQESGEDNFNAELKAIASRLGEGYQELTQPTGEAVFPLTVSPENTAELDAFLEANGYTVSTETDDTIRFPNKNEARKSKIDGLYGNPDQFFYRIGGKDRGN